jgi:uncharacterized integral membrane protein
MPTEQRPSSRSVPPAPHGALAEQRTPVLPDPTPEVGVDDAAHPRGPVARSRAGAAWVGICFSVLVLVLLIVFMLQNTAPVEVRFFGMTGSAPLALTLLIAGVGVGLVTLIVGSVRIGQLRRRIGHDRNAR